MLGILPSILQPKVQLERLVIFKQNAGRYYNFVIYSLSLNNMKSKLILLYISNQFKWPVLKRKPNMQTAFADHFKHLLTVNRG